MRSNAVGFGGPWEARPTVPRALRSGALLVVLSLSFGCASLSTLQTPDTVPEGEVRVHFGAHAVGLNRDENGLLRPQVELAARYGATPWLDLGVKVFPAGGELGAKLQFLDGDLDFSVAPAVAVFGTGSDAGSAFSFLFHLPLLFGVDVTEAVQIAFGLKFFLAALAGSEAEDNALPEGLYGGLFLGVPILIETFWLAPEVNLYVPLSNDPFGALSFVMGVGIYYGGAPEGDLDEEWDEDVEDEEYDEDDEDDEGEVYTGD
ncbi:MAG: hypothetical protein AAGF12_10515 [Myxococcota bacterium]